MRGEVFRMNKNRYWKQAALVGAFLVAVVFDAAAQARAGAEPRMAGASGPVRLREISGIGTRGLVRTPEYNSSVSRGRTAARSWAEILVQFDTDPDWVDELQFQYYVLLYSRQTREFLFLKGNVTHMDVARGRGHLSAMYVRPAALERHGDVVAIAVEAVLKGETVTVGSEGRLPQGMTLPAEWWKTTKLVPRDGYLLNRNQTPFAFVNYDDYEVVK